MGGTINDEVEIAAIKAREKRALGYFVHADAARDEFEPRSSEVCPHCGNLHAKVYASTISTAQNIHNVHWWCDVCTSFWTVRGGTGNIPW